MSTNASMVMNAAHNDADNFGASINLKNISETEARKLMSAEHKALGYRPPPGSLAAEAQAAASKHPQTVSHVPEEQLAQAAIEDAARIKSQRVIDGIDFSAIGEAQARKLMSEEHKALGHRPPPGSLAAQAQAAAAKHPQGAAATQPLLHDLQRAALEDAAVTEGAAANGIDLNYIGEAEARKLMSEEHKALGYRPPQGSLAAAAQAAAAKHPSASAGIDAATIAKAALEDAKKIEIIRQAEAIFAEPSLNINTITTEEARQLQSEEQKTLGYRPPSDSLAAQVQSALNVRSHEVVTKEEAASIQSDEQKRLGHRPEAGTIAATSQSLADKNENDGRNRTFSEAGL